MAKTLTIEYSSVDWTVNYFRSPMNAPDSLLEAAEPAEKQTFNLTLHFLPGRGLELRNGAWALFGWSEGILDKTNRELCLKAAWDWINENNPDKSVVNLNVKE